MNPNLVFTQITAGAACAYLLQLLQRWKMLPWVTSHTHAINVIIRVVLSAAATAGISWNWNSSVSGHVLSITIPAMSVILHGLWQWFGQYALQHGWGQVLNIGTLRSVETPVEVKSAETGK